MHDTPPRFPPTPDGGLSSLEAARRVAAGYVNRKPDPPSKTVGEIIRSNLLTRFNLLNAILALLVLLTGSWRNLLFMGVVISNTVIGTVQELRAKHTLDKLSLLNAPSTRLLRDGAELEAPVDAIVLGDLMLLTAGQQICADAVVRSGSCEVDESLVTGESEPVVKQPGDSLLSGSFVVAGACRAEAIHVGAENFASRLTLEAKVHKKPNSELMRSLEWIIKIISIAILPVGILLFGRQFFLTGEPAGRAIVSTVAAVLGMIPEGLMLLTSVALTVGVLRLAYRRTLVQELYCIETLARADILCLDKTGTLTEGQMRVERILPADGISEAMLRQSMADYLAPLETDNATTLALRAYCAGITPASPTALRSVPFSSARKWGGVQLAAGTLLLGAPSVLFPGSAVTETADVLSAEGGSRVLVLAASDLPLPADGLPDQIRLLGYILIADPIRPEAPDTLRFFKEQGVDLLILSGDSPATVAKIAADAGFTGAGEAVDASRMSDEALVAALDHCRIFGRVTPYHKRLLVGALKKQGHTVAMTGDGVNDVLALKDADCGIAMASGSDAARQVAQLVLLDNNFASLPHVVAEGRRVINNIQRSSSLFLIKNIFSFLLAVLLIVFSLDVAYPLLPIQLTLFSVMWIGAPSFVLALEPNDSPIRGRFLETVLARSLPGGITIVLVLLAAIFLTQPLDLSTGALSTVCLFLVGWCGLVNLLLVCWPLNLLRGLLCAAMTLGFLGAAFLFPDFFFLVPLPGRVWLRMLLPALCAPALIVSLDLLVRRLVARYDRLMARRSAHPSSRRGGHRAARPKS